jgi:hypothetical protein
MPAGRTTLGGLFVLAFVAALVAVGLASEHAEWVEVSVILGFGVVMLFWAHQWGRATRQQNLIRRRLLRLLPNVVIPRPDATVGQLKELGAALTRWWQDTAGGPGRPLCWIDQDALHDLQAGELPQPFALRLLTEVNATDGPHMNARELREALLKAGAAYPRLGELLPRPDARTVSFGFGEGRPPDRRQVVESLRGSIPEDLVEDVLVDGRSWNEAAE